MLNKLIMNRLILILTCFFAYYASAQDYMEIWDPHMTQCHGQIPLKKNHMIILNLNHDLHHGIYSISHNIDIATFYYGIINDLPPSPSSRSRTRIRPQFVPYGPNETHGNSILELFQLYNQQDIQQEDVIRLLR